MDAVDSAQGPEVEDNDFTAQVLEQERCFGPNPAHATLQFRSNDALGHLCLGEEGEAAESDKSEKNDPRDASLQGKNGPHCPAPSQGKTRKKG
jgi:hypothetical protein